MQMNYFLKKNWLNKVAEDVKENSGDITKKASKTKTGALIAGAVIAFAGIGTFIFSKIKKDKQAQANDNEQINTAQKTDIIKTNSKPCSKNKLLSGHRCFYKKCIIFYSENFSTSFSVIFTRAS